MKSIWKWSITGFATAASFGIFLWGTAVVQLPSPFPKQDTADRWLIAATLALLVATCVFMGMTPWAANKDGIGAARRIAKLANLPATNPHFTNRRSQLREVRKAFNRKNRVVTLYDLGGAGKTQVALEYAYRHTRRYRLRWWSAAESSLSVAQALALLAVELNAPDADLEKTASIVRTELSRRKRWLLVLDNAEEPSEVRPYIPSGGGSVLLTSRNPAFDSIGKTVEVGVLSRNDATKFLLKRTSSHDRSSAAEIATALGRLPLALAQAAGYVTTTPGLSLRGYLERLDRTKSKILELGTPADYPEPVARAWLLNFEKLSASTPSATEVLRLCSFLAPESPIPLHLLTSNVDLLPDALRSEAVNDTDLDDSIRALYRYSLASRDENGLRVHRLVQEITRHALGDESRVWSASAVAIVVAALSEAVRKPEPRIEVTPLIPHAIHLADTAEESPEVAEVLTLVGEYLTNQGEY